MFRRRQEDWHKFQDFTWVLAMTKLAFTSFLITGVCLGQLSEIHLLSMVGLVRGLWLIRQRRIRGLALQMQALYLQALFVKEAI